MQTHVKKILEDSAQTNNKTLGGFTNSAVKFKGYTYYKHTFFFSPSDFWLINLLKDTSPRQRLTVRQLKLILALEGFKAIDPSPTRQVSCAEIRCARSNLLIYRRWDSLDRDQSSKSGCLILSREICAGICQFFGYHNKVKRYLRCNGRRIWSFFLFYFIFCKKCRRAGWVSV